MEASSTVKKGYWGRVCGTGASTWRQERPFHEAVEVRPALLGDPSHGGEASHVGRLPRRGADRIWPRSREERMQSAVMGGVGEVKSRLSRWVSDLELQDLAFAVFSLAGSAFPPFWNGNVYFMPSYVGSMCFAIWFWFYRGSQLTDCIRFRRDFGL